MLAGLAPAFSRADRLFAIALADQGPGSTVKTLRLLEATRLHE
jgi:hypothetical protein